MDDTTHVILVCGGRTHDDPRHVYMVLDCMLFQHGSVIVFQGACTKGGADLHAENWAKSREQIYVGIPAEWKRYGKRAGMKRNSRMFDLAMPNSVIAFKGGPGTIGMCQYAKSKGVVPYLAGWKYA